MGDVGLDAQQNHVIAFNTWQGEGAPPPPPDSLGMRYFTIVLPDSTQLETVAERVGRAGGLVEPTQDGFIVHDPSQIGIVLTVEK